MTNEKLQEIQSLKTKIENHQKHLDAINTNVKVRSQGGKEAALSLNAYGYDAPAVQLNPEYQIVNPDIMISHYIVALEAKISKLKTEFAAL